MLLKKKNLSTVIETAKTGKGSQDKGKKIQDEDNCPAEQEKQHTCQRLATVTD